MDGRVNAADPEVLMGSWGQEVNDPTLIAHWTLDEASGLIAADSAGTNDGILMGNLVWQPTGGKIGGALQFDGGPRFVITMFVGDLAAAAVITNGAWHRVSFVWDGENRILYVDGVEVARDSQIGAGSTLAPVTFWSGLIDDVRIYNRTVKP